MPGIVVDTSAFISALRSKRGASYRLLQLLIDAHWVLNMSVVLALEYEMVGKREANKLGIPGYAVDDMLIRCVGSVGITRSIFDCDRKFPTRMTSSSSTSPLFGDRISSDNGNQAMSRTLTLPDEIMRQAEEMAAFERVSMEEFVSAKLSEQFAGLKYLKRRAERASIDKFRARRIRSVLSRPNHAVSSAGRVIRPPL